MSIIRYLLERKLLTFVIATVLFQISVVLVGLVVKMNANDDENLVKQSLEYSESELQEDLALEKNLQPDSDIVDPVSQVRTISHKIKSGETFSKIWTSYSGDYSSALEAFDALQTAGIEVSDLRVGLEASLTIQANEVTKFELELSDARKVILELKTDGYQATLYKPEVIETERTISGVIDSSFAASADTHKIPYQIVDELVDLFSARIEFRRDVQVGDSFTVMYTERKLADGRLLEPGAIRGASFQNNGRWMAAIAHNSGHGETAFYDEQGNPLGEFFLRYPVQFSRISSMFSHARFHPVLKRVRPHNGVDFAAPIGTPVRSVAAGVIEDVGYRGGAGKMVKIKHNDKYTTAYLHLNSFAKNIARGRSVDRGQVIGTVGMTGTATGPHLHYSLYINGKYTDPLKAQLPQLPKSESAIPKDYLDDMILALKTSQDSLQLALLGDTSEKKVG